LRWIEQYDNHGGLPGTCFIRSEKLRTQKLLDQIETIVDRDLRQVHDTTLVLPELMRLLRELALRDGAPLQHQQLRRATGISPITQKKLLFALEAVFIIRSVPIEGDYRGSAHFFEDQAEVAILARDRLSDEQKWAGLIFRNLREQVSYRIGVNAEFFQYRTRAGVCIPFAIRTPDSVLGFIPVRGGPSRTAMAACHSFLRRYANGKIVLVSDANETRIIDERTLYMPATQLLFPQP
jgi:predicted AAA+ superfamily ATPase